MKTLGLIGGTSWTSTMDYYRHLNKGIAEHLGGLHSARLVLSSLDFAELEVLMRANYWGLADDLIRREIRRLDIAGVDGVLLCSNLLHRFYNSAQKTTTTPILHIGDALASVIQEKGYRRIGLLGTKPTMEERFYADHIKEKANVSVIAPPADDRAYIDTAIFDRMCRNVYTDADREKIKGIISDLKNDGADAVILGCTELPILLRAAELPLLDSTCIHCRDAIDWMVKDTHAMRPENRRKETRERLGLKR